MRYRYLNLRINSAIDACISCETFVKFGPVTPELTEFICERQVRHGKKVASFGHRTRVISGRTLPIFAIFTPYESAFSADDKSGPYFFNLARDVAMAT